MAGVRIPIYQQQTNLQNGAPAPDVPMVAPTNNVGTAIQGVGQALGQVADAQALVQRDAAATEVARVTSQVGLQLNQLKNDTLANAPVGGYGLTDGFNQKFQDLRTQTLDGVTNPYAQKYLNAYFDHQAQVYGSAMQDQQTTMRAKYIGQNVSDAGDNGARTVSQDPSQFNASLAPVVASINSLEGIGGDMKLTWTKKVTEQAAYAAGLRTATDNPQGFLNAIKTPVDQAPPAGFEWIRSIDPEKANMLRNHAQTLVQRQDNAVQTQVIANQNASTDAYNQAFDMIDKGQVPSLDAQNDLLAKAALVGPDEVAKAKELIATGNTHGGFASMNFAQRQAELSAEQSASTTTGAGVDATQSRVVASRAALNEKIQTIAKQNPWQAAQTYGVTQNAPVNPILSVDDAVNVVQSRASAQGRVEAWVGNKVSPFQPEEAHQLLRVLTPLSDEAKAQALQQLGAAIGDPTRIGALTDQWKDEDKDRHMSLSMIYGARGVNGGPLLTNNGIPVSTFILAGERAKQDGTVKIDGTADAGLRAQIARKIDGTLPPQEAEDAKQAAYLMAIGNAARNGRTVPDATIDIQTALDTATGGLSNTGGVPLSTKNQQSFNSTNAYQTARPYGWSDAEFQNGVKAAGVANIENQIGGKPIDTVVANGHTIPATDFMSKFPSYRLQRVGIGGTYWVFAGQKFVTDKSGENLRVHLAKPTTGGSTAVPPTAPADSLGSAASGYLILSPM